MTTVTIEDDISRSAWIRDTDLFLLHLNQVIESGVELAAAASVTTTVHRMDRHDLCRAHVEASGHPVEAERTVVDKQRQFGQVRRFYVRLNDGTRTIEDGREPESHIAQRWGGV